MVIYILNRIHANYQGTYISKKLTDTLYTELLALEGLEEILHNIHRKWETGLIELR